jgi:peptidoglycan/xylan/chitin deacetylase (PgdA/CDA1 family)
MISVCFRFDDPSPTSDHRLEQNIIDLLQRHGACCTFAVIPFRAPKNANRLLSWSEQKAGHLVEAADAGFIEIAQHGTTHVRLSETDAGVPSEFHLMPFDEQVQRIREGRSELERVFGAKISGFVPPWNTYDENTTKAAGELGFKYLSPSLEIFHSGQVAIIPKTCNMLGARAAVEEAIRFESLSPAVVVVLHPYQFEEFHKQPDPGERPPFTSLEQFGDLLSWLGRKHNVEVVTLNQLAESTFQQHSPWRFEDLSWFRYLPYRARQRFPNKVVMRCGQLEAFASVGRKLITS